MRKVVLIAALALVGVPGAALAAKPTHPATPANSHANSNASNTSATGTSSNAKTKGQSAKVMFVLHGELGAYTAANGSTNGSITITVTSSNHESSALKTMTLTFPVSSRTKVEGTVRSGDKGIVKVRAPKNASATTLQTLTAFQVIDQGASS
jgi:hypothetical protein